MSRFVRIVTTVVAAIIIIVLGWRYAPSRIEHVNGPLRHEAYVWQRAWSAALTDRLNDVQPLQGLVVLAAEMSWTGGEAHTVMVAMDEPALVHTGKPIGLAIRINTFSGSFDAAADQVANMVEQVVQRAERAGLHVDEVQLDFDCPTSKLGGYRAWVNAVRDKLPAEPIAVTVLPSWMNSGDFGPLVSAAGGFVLQVHSVQRPESMADVPPLCEPRKAKQWVEQAARFGVPFRVALPTYAYVLGFDASGKFIGAASEGGRRWPNGATLMRLSADADAMATLVRTWTDRRPALMTGLIWYRLPIASDTLNWRWPTLAAVMAGHVKPGEVRVEVTPAPAGWLDVKLRNAGQTDVPMNVQVALRWTGDEPIARDVLGGFMEIERQPGRWTLRPGNDFQPAVTVLGAGDERTIAWMRFEKNMEVRADVTSMDH